MSLVTQPTIEGVLAEFLSAGVIILAGIFLESRKSNQNESRKLKRASVVLTVVGLVVFALTTQLDWLLILPLVVYSGLGLLIAIANVSWLFWLFGSKTYGSLMFSIAIFHIPGFQKKIYEIIFSLQMTEALNMFLVVYYCELVFVWIVIAVIVWVLAREIGF
jgi:hypothetical protein